MLELKQGKLKNFKLFSCHSKRYLAIYLSNSKKELYVNRRELRDVDKYFHSKGNIFYQSKITGEKFTEEPKDYTPAKYRKFNDAEEKHKKILKQINFYLNQIKLPRYYFSKASSCYKDNATFHRGNTKFILMDISSFFPNCTFEKVKEFCVKESGLNMVKTIVKEDGTKISQTDVADAFARLVTAPKNKNLNNRIIPQGYPTSTAISFLSYKEMFEEIADYAHSFNYKFSVYVDDLTFSYIEEKIDPYEFKNQVVKILEKYGHTSNPKKVKIIDIEKIKNNSGNDKYKGTIPIITGIFLKRYKVKAAPHIHKNLNRMFNKVNSAGPSKNSKEYMTNWKNFNSLLGLYNTVDFIEPKTKNKRIIIKKLINRKQKDFMTTISPNIIKKLKWEDKIFNAYKSGRLNEFYIKNKDILVKKANYNKREKKDKLLIYS